MGRYTETFLREKVESYASLSKGGDGTTQNEKAAKSKKTLKKVVETFEADHSNFDL